VLGILVATLVVLAIATSANLGNASDEPSSTQGWVQLTLGVLLLLIALRQRRRRPTGDEPASLPSWMAAIDHMSPVKTAGLGFALAAVNPKNLLLWIAAGVSITGGSLDGGQQVISVLTFTLIAASTVLVPVIGYAVMREQLRGPLDDLKRWLQQNNATVMAVLMLVIGVTLVGKGISALG
jgi:threonine/homoserine/homoserine lactone efflux protein